MQRLAALSAITTVVLLAACSSPGVAPPPGLAATPSPTPGITLLSGHRATPSPTPESDTHGSGSAPGPVVLLQQDCVIDLKVDAQGLYWSTCNGTVVTLPNELEEPRVLATGQRFPHHIVVKEDNVYWIEGAEAANDTEFSIMKVSRQGGEATRLAQDGARISSFAMDDTYLYWFACPVSDGRLWRVAQEGGAPAVVAEGTCAGSMVLSEEYVYWVDGGLRRAKNDGSQAEMLVPNAGLDDALQSIGVGLRPEYHAVGISQIIRVSGADVYLIAYVNNNPGMVSCTDNHSELLRYSTESGALSHWPGVASNAYVATDEVGGVYLASSDCWAPGDGIVVITDTGERFAVAAGGGRKGPIAADDTTIYWWNQDSRNLEKMEK